VKIKKKVKRKKDIKDIVVETAEIQGLLQDLLFRLSQVFERYRTLVLASIAAIVILIILGVGYHYLSLRWDREASVLEGSAYSSYTEGNYQKSISLYQEVLDKYSGSESAPVAMYYIGNSYLASGQSEKAIGTYNKFIKDHDDQVIILPLVYLNLGYSYLNMKDYNNAISAFKQASALKGSLVADRAAYESARVYETAGDKVSAIDRYEYLVKTYPNSPWSQDASAKLNKVQGNIPKDRQPKDHQQDNR